MTDDLARVTSRGLLVRSHHSYDCRLVQIGGFCSSPYSVVLATINPALTIAMITASAIEILLEPKLDTAA